MNLPPIGWHTATLNDLLASDGLFSDGDWVESKDQDPNGNNRLLQLADVGDGIFLNKSSRFVNDDKFTALGCTEVRAGDVLVARMPDPLGRACLVPDLPQRCLTVVDVAIFRVGTSNVSNKWLMYLINSPAIRGEIERRSSGTTRKRISRSKLGAIDIPVPPSAEQTRIADKLDELLAQVGTLKARIDGIPALLKRFRQSVLESAASGRLATGRGSGNPARWEVMRAVDICEKVQSGGTPKKSGFTHSGIPFLKVYNIVDQKVDFDYRPQYIPDSVHNGPSSKSITRPGDVLMNIVGPPLGKVATVPDTYPEWNINQAITLFRPSDKILSGWISIAILGGHSLREVLNETKGSAGQVNISLSQCRNFIFPVPSVDEQTEIVCRVEQLFAFADQLEARVAAAQERIDKLTQSILAKAFRGELVPQDPNDEPASVLLERIKAQRAAAPKAKRGRKAKA